MAALMTNLLARSFNFFGHDAKHAFSALHLRDVVTGLFNQLCIRAVPGKNRTLGINITHVGFLGTFDQYTPWICAV